MGVPHIEVTRTLELDDLSVRTEGDLREIEAYAAVFDRPAEIRDFEGHYHERLNVAAFDKTLHERGRKARAIFNHGQDIFGLPSDRFAMPFGVPTLIQPDGIGLRTVTRVSHTPLGDEVLELAKDGAITGFSFRGRFLQTRKHAAGPDGLPVFERMESTLTEFGPAVFPAYEDASILAVRAASMFSQLDDEGRAALLQVAGLTPEGAEPTADEPAAGHSETQPDDWRDRAMRSVLQFQVKGLPDGPEGSTRQPAC